MEQRGKENRLITRRAARRRQRTRAGSAARPSPWRPGSARQGRRSAPRGGSCMALMASSAGAAWVIGHDNARARGGRFSRARECRRNPKKGKSKPERSPKQPNRATPGRATRGAGSVADGRHHAQDQHAQGQRSERRGAQLHGIDGQQRGGRLHDQQRRGRQLNRRGLDR